MLAALIATLTPVESPVPLGPLEGLAGSAPAEAQTSAVSPGMPDSCTTPWQPDPDDASLCVLSRPACPEHPLQPGSYLAPSTEFPDFCEATVLEPADPAAYADCRALTGYVIKRFVQSGDRACRMVHPTQCAQKMNRTGTNTCKRVQRRKWSCPSGTPTNRFNTCYQAPPNYVGAHPACGAGAPGFAISSCEDYVSRDFVRAPAPNQCSGFDTGDTRSALRNLVSSSNLYWCQFDSSYLDVGCYGTGATCTPSDAVCVKRASTTGGCNAIAKALRCRKLQADYLDGSVTAEDTYLAGCTPCVVLPFSPTPPDCPQDLRVDPSRSTEGRLEDTHQRRSDVGPHGSATFCADPPRGRLVWESSHHSELALVNSPVILRVVDVPATSRHVEYIYVDISSSRPYKAQFWPRRRQYFEYPDSAPSDPIVRPWPTFDTSVTYGSVDKIVGGRQTSGGYIENSGTCLIRVRPDFRVRIEELWPDDDATDIEALFGSDALNWWTALAPPQRRAHTEARGLNFVGGMTAAQRAAELARRAGDLTEVVRCNYGTQVWCRWSPSRPGYYRLVAAGAWYMTKFARIRRWLSTAWLAWIDETLKDAAAAKDGDCPDTPGRPYHSDADCLSDNLVSMGVSPAEAGLKSDLSGLLAAGPSEEWLYTAAAGPNVTCPPRDLRVTCAGTSESSNYTETEPVGVLVHEMRVSTVTPDR